MCSTLVTVTSFSEILFVFLSFTTITTITTIKITPTGMEMPRMRGRLAELP